MIELNSIIASIFVVLFLVGTTASKAESELFDFTMEPHEVDKYWTRIYAAPPVYPRKAMERGIDGCAVFTFIISENGDAENIKLFDTMPPNTFAQYAQQALKKYRWRATEANQALQRIKTSVTIRFAMVGEHRSYSDQCNTPDMIESESTPDPFSGSEQNHLPPLKVVKQCSAKSNSRLLKQCD